MTDTSSSNVPDASTLKQYLENAGVPSDTAERLAEIKAKYLEGGDVSSEEEQEGLQLVDGYREQVKLAKENLRNDDYSLERLMDENS